MKLEALKTQGKQFLQKLKQDKRAMIILIVGVALMLLVAVFDLSSPKKEQVVQLAAEASSLSTEETLCALLAQMKGAGRVQVMITYTEGTETVFAADSDATEEEKETSVSRKEKNNYVILKGDGAQSGLVQKEIMPKVRGVAVVCDGGADPVLKAQIVSAVSALFDIKSTNISVAEMAAEGGNNHGKNH